jgi:DNA-binding CsgD family transcriptional regulator
VANCGLTELVEAAAWSGVTKLAADALERLSAMTRASGTDCALGVECRSRALLNEGNAAEPLYREAIERLGRTRVRVELARARLLYGEWRVARTGASTRGSSSEAAHEMFSGIGAEAFAERARRELLGHRRDRPQAQREHSRDLLTPQEAQTAQLAATASPTLRSAHNCSSAPRTVQYHLHNVLQKLDITSRNQLNRIPASQLNAG